MKLLFTYVIYDMQLQAQRLALKDSAGWALGAAATPRRGLWCTKTTKWLLLLVFTTCSTSQKEYTHI
jgi:hypothetical protein